MENEFDDPFADDETNADRFVIYVNNRQKEIKNYQIDPVNHETIVYISTRGKKWIPPAEPVVEDRLENDNYFNAAPADFPAGILSRSYDPITGVYIVHPQLAVAESAEPEDEEDYCDSDDDDLNSVYSLDENNVNQNVRLISVYIRVYSR
ncbi:unnamed protein product [Ceratitis capitata]|uniref:(Mediterranean fruit fly) hypothetical protein n=1 Tax=Ceratitis capitata TaxID=7213 RepID=A0A811U2L8_CERCA|nr:unnamed protein product [Ceratitis capitata]